MDPRVVVLSEPSGLFFTGPDTPEPWLDDSRHAMRFTSPGDAWLYAKDLARAQAEFLQGDPIRLELYDRDTNEASHLVSTDAVYPVLRGQWKRTLAEPLPHWIFRTPRKAPRRRARA